MLDRERLTWLALAAVKGIGAVRFRRLIEAFGSAEAVWAATPAQLRQVGLPQAVLASLLAAREAADPAALQAQLAKHAITALTWADEDYPRRLKELESAPAALYVRGDLLPEDDWAVAIVGTRRLTAYGRQVAQELAAFLARHGITVVSGLAKGIDGAAHKAALDAGGRTLAVVAHGLDMVYPPEHTQLAAEIAKSGALLSDYALGIQPDAANFPPRNRIISGLAQAVVVIEAGEQSGALITAGYAAEQGREVFAVPGPIYAPQSRGCNMLIERGAHPLVRFEALLEILELNTMDAKKAARVSLPADATEAKLFGLLGAEPLHLNEIGVRADLPIAQVSSALALMELKGLVRQVGGMTYIAARELRAAYD